VIAAMLKLVVVAALLMVVALIVRRIQRPGEKGPPSGPCVASLPSGGLVHRF
jgi:hypothetical protein